MKKMTKGLLAVVAVGAVSVAQAAVINYNVLNPGGGNPAVAVNGTDWAAGVAPIAYTSNVWNEAAGVGATDMVDSEGASTTVDIAFTATDSLFNWATAGGGNGTMMNYVGMHNGFGNPLTGPGTIALTGLAALGEYQIAIVSQGDKDVQGGTFQVGAAPALVSTGAGFGDALTSGTNFVMFSSVFADVSGNLDITVTAGPASNWAVVDAVQITAIPEPATISLIVLFSGSILFIRRRFMV